MVAIVEQHYTCKKNLFSQVNIFKQFPCSEGVNFKALRQHVRVKKSHKVSKSSPKNEGGVIPSHPSRTYGLTLYIMYDSPFLSASL